jgi:hypothetical protein
MADIAKFVYEVKPGRLADFLSKLHQAADPRFSSAVMPKSFRLVPEHRPRAGHGTCDPLH